MSRKSASEVSGTRPKDLMMKKEVTDAGEIVTDSIGLIDYG